MSIFCLTGLAASRQLRNDYFAAVARMQAAEAGREAALRDRAQAAVQLDSIEAASVATSSLKTAQPEIAGMIQKARASIETQARQSEADLHAAQAKKRTLEDDLHRLKADILKNATDADRAYFRTEAEFDEVEEAWEDAVADRRNAQVQLDALARASDSIRRLKAAVEKQAAHTDRRVSELVGRKAELQKELDRLKDEVSKKRD
jgi:chromosome segregation ATPase